MEINEKCLLIDEHALDKECLTLPSLIMQVADLAAKRRQRLDELNTQLEVTEADIDKKIRNSPETYGLEKVTESAIKSVVATNPIVLKRLEEIRDAKYNLDLASGLLTALDAKKKSLTLLVELHGIGYFSNPRVSEKGKEAVNQITRDSVYSRQKAKMRDREDKD
jgi:hypothetical protein